MTQTNTVVLGWNRVVTGREGHAAELFTTTTAWLDKQRATSRIESWEPVFLDRHGGDLNGFFLIKGTHAQIDAMLGSDDWQDLVMRGDHCLLGLGVITGHTGMPAITDLMQRWTKHIPTTR